MAITFPLPFPAGAGFLEGEFTLGEVQAVNTLRSGAVQAMELGDSLWSGRFVTSLCDARQRGRWQAWKGALNGSIGTFLAYDPDKQYPLAYGAGVLALTRFGGGAFDGNATLAAWTATTLQITGLPAAYQAADGDMVSFPWNGGKALHMIVGDTAASAGGVLDVTVVPPVRISPAPSGGAAVALVKPSCIMRLRPGSFSAPTSRARRSVSFEGVQIP